jgi:capsular exopolysaccharide synthesis family protein
VVRRRRRQTVPLATTIAADEAFRVLRSNILVALSDLANPVVVVTSANASEGKTTVCAGLAASLASIGQRIVVIDFDLRAPALHRHFAAHNEFGVTSFLLDRQPLNECLQYVDLTEKGEEGKGLYLLAAGPAVSSPTELLTAERTQRLLQALSDQADVVLVDSPPVLPIADTLEIGRMAAGAVLVVEARRTEIGAAQRAKDALIKNRTRLLGVIVNKVPRDEISAAYGPPLGAKPDATPNG